MKKIRHIVLNPVVIAAALVALYSCAKVETMDSAEEKVLISFNVGKGLKQTKVSNGTSLINEGCTEFWCNAWYTATSGNTMRFMNEAEVQPDALVNPSQWAPAIDHFWPRTGTIDFFSYATARSLDGYLSITNDGKTFTISDYTITSRDNILIADAVYNASRTNSASLNDINDTENTSDPTGVPTLFRHLLAQVQMDLQLYTATPTTNTTYEVTVTNITLSNLLDKGSITLTNTNGGSDAFSTQPWSPASNGTVVGWVPSQDAVRKVVDLTPDDNSIILPPGSDEGDHVIFLRGGSVMPQALDTGDGMQLTMTVTIRTKHGDPVNGYTIYNEDENIVYNASFPTLGMTEWKMNQKIVYHITINPVTTTLSFNPSIEPWDSPDIDAGTINL